MTPKWSECPSNSYSELSSLENGECKSAIVGTVPSYTSCSGLPTVNTMCSLSSQKKDGNVYKRRKMDKDSNTLAAYEEGKETMIQSCTTSKDQSSLLLPVVPSGKMTLSSTAGITDPILDCGETAGVLVDPSSDMNDRCMVSSSTPSFMTLEKKDAAECSSSNTCPTEPIVELISARDVAIGILKEDLFTTESRTRITKEESTDNVANPLFACNTCGGEEYLLKMLICDSCEAAFHLSCCNPCIKELPSDDWFCKTCLLKKPKGVYGKLSEGKVKPSGNTNQRPHGMSHIEYMLKDTEQYVSGARIGRDFQADVPEWSGPTFSTDGFFDHPSEFDPAELIQSNSWETGNQNRDLIGTWIQCRETVNFGGSDKVCGKWRRAPLYVVQSDDWDCSCCLLWDPARADCAVPQVTLYLFSYRNPELKTSEVLKQLKYVNMLRNEAIGENQKPV
ncbi:hypothetical protein EJB05_35659 [Eragrostis curvula]|uniref:PHD-type domain-containing protein n=1 Tax=Eragrostis curvula TaxID=38414 RepID=A0A5J9U869_9POAL|nr:hypothetical protein EJB05_35659 [Eragrostis curvula]